MENLVFSVGSPCPRVPPIRRPLVHALCPLRPLRETLSGSFGFMARAESRRARRKTYSFGQLKCGQRARR